MALFYSINTKNKFYSHSIIYGRRNQLTDNNFNHQLISHTVLYTVTGKQYHVKYHAQQSPRRRCARMFFLTHKLCQLLLHTLPLHGQIC